MSSSLAKACSTGLPSSCQLESLGDIACGGESLLTLFALVVLVELETFEGSTTGYDLVGELSLVIWVVIASALVVDLVMGVLRFT